MKPPGDVAEWLRSGLQSRLHRFDSGRRLSRAEQCRRRHWRRRPARACRGRPRSDRRREPQGVSALLPGGGASDASPGPRVDHEHLLDLLVRRGRPAGRLQDLEGRRQRARPLACDRQRRMVSASTRSCQGCSTRRLGCGLRQLFLHTRRPSSSQASCCPSMGASSRASAASRAHGEDRVICVGSSLPAAARRSCEGITAAQAAAPSRGIRPARQAA